MNNLVTIQSNVPICPECGAAIHLNPVNLVYSCSSCSAKHKVIDFGHSEREFICERIIYESKRNVYVPGTGAESRS